MFYWKLLWKGGTFCLSIFGWSVFQSLFYWKLLWKLFGCNLEISMMKFQSLFYWKLLWKALVVLDSKDLKAKFQSLFYWKLLWKCTFRFRPNSHSKVSILVLLEIALEDTSCFIVSLLQPRFNPCSIGNCSGRMVNWRTIGTYSPGFNPCSIGNCSGSWRYYLPRWQNIVLVSILVLLEIALEVKYRISY